MEFVLRGMHDGKAIEFKSEPITTPSEPGYDTAFDDEEAAAARTAIFMCRSFKALRILVAENGWNKYLGQKVVGPS